MQIRSIGIIGAGTMGNGIAQVAAGAGFESFFWISTMLP
jgi:3-hydroxyacyl-CoA dehydrogenase